MKIFLTFILTIILVAEIESQVVIGKIVDENGKGLSSIALQLYINSNIYNTTTSTNGSFIFDIVTGIEEGQLPTGYAVSNNFPNPFNPTTRIGITLPIRENVKIEVFNLLGQEVINAIEQPFNAGTSFIDIELNGLANGIYNARVTIENKYTVVKKMMLVYGSQHLAISWRISNTELHKSNNTNVETNLDSLIATSLIIGRKTFMSLPGATGDTLDLGNLTIERYCLGIPTVIYESKIYNTVQIGSQCWLKENLNVGTMIDGLQNQTDNSIIEKYCRGNNPTNCDTYGGLYQWNEVMQYITFPPGTRGICPSGWHIPTQGEFEILSNTVSSDGNALKAIGQGTGAGAGTNTSGFSALLAGNEACFWSSTQAPPTSGYYMFLVGPTGFVYDYETNGEDCGLSVRCIKGEWINFPPNIPSNPSPADNDTAVFTSVALTWSCSDPDSDALIYDVYFGTDNPPATKVGSNLMTPSLNRYGLSNNTTYYWQIEVKDNHGDLTSGPVWRFTTGGPFGLPCPGMPMVEYSGKTYNTVQIGSQCWLKENLVIGTMIQGSDTAKDNGIIEKYCYDNKTANCNTYGGLYMWDEAMQYTIAEGTQGICPSGWHIPTNDELQTLNSAVVGDGNALKAIGQGVGYGIGTNTSDFSALLAGSHFNDGGFSNLTYIAYFWSSTASISTMALGMYLIYNEAYIYFPPPYMGNGYSVRCLKD